MAKYVLNNQNTQKSRNMSEGFRFKKLEYINYLIIN